ncbi:threonine/serine exporter family protein [Aeromonas veronii]|uniref:threonine/serine exporter family protein n=1 Tax=Aeromonas veronii TaxID=654 RepID=UPI0024440895|nr:threonine/serine exporter family protein [Aeromonas veronii]
MRSITPRRVLSREQQTEITRIIVKVGQMLAQFGAESRIIEQTTVRLGMALGLESVEMAISSSAIVLTSLYQGGLRHHYPAGARTWHQYAGGVRDPADLHHGGKRADRCP